MVCGPRVSTSEDTRNRTFPELEVVLLIYGEVDVEAKSLSRPQARWEPNNWSICLHLLLCGMLGSLERSPVQARAGEGSRGRHLPLSIEPVLIGYLCNLKTNTAKNNIAFI